MSGAISEKFSNIFSAISGAATNAVSKATSIVTLPSNTKKPNSVPTTTASAAIMPIGSITTMGAITTTSGLFSVSGLIGLAGYLLSIIVVIMIIILFVHYFITPVIKQRPGSPGYIYLGTDNGVLFWKDGNRQTILNKDTPIASIYYNYTMMIDVKISAVIPFGTMPRVLFTRGATKKDPPSGSTTTLASIFESYNLAVALKPDTNDLIVSTMNKDKLEENVILNNVPINSTFRLGIVLREKALEVYVNGRLIRTRALSTTLLDQKGDIAISSTAKDNDVASLRNLKIWSSILSTAELQGATPSMPSDSTMGGSGLLPPMDGLCT
jgi:hypothetical protein